MLVPTDDLAALIAALRQAVGDPDLRERLGAAARADVDAAFGMDRYVAAFVDLYEELAAAKGVRR